MEVEQPSYDKVDYDCQVRLITHSVELTVPNVRNVPT